MKRIIKQLTIFLILCSFSVTAQENFKSNLKNELLTKQEDFFNLLNIKNVPQTERGYNLSVFTDNGSWSGYALPENESRDYAGAFIGPMIMTGKGWVSASLATPELVINRNPYDLARNVQTVKYLPGKLVQEFSDEQIHFKTELCFVTSRTAAVRSIIKNVSNEPLKISMLWNGGVFEGGSTIEHAGNCFNILRSNDSVLTVVNFRTANKSNLVTKDSLQALEIRELILEPNSSYQANYSQTVMLKGENVGKELSFIENINIDNCFEENTRKWNDKLHSVLDGDSKYLSDNKYRKVIVKAMLTLNSNWRSAAGDILHAGSYPSYNGFFGIWSWDSWKIASANVFYNPEMAKDEMRALFDYQADNGMVPDLIRYDKKGNNWRDSKPPVASWGAMNVFKETQDYAFLEEMFGKLYKFHQWWYTDRDHDNNGVCEYGSTDGSLIAAAWESGMDNGVRFDDAVMLKNGDNAWSMNQENICLNSFLYVDKKMLSEMALLLNKPEIAKELTAEAEKLKEHIQNKMFDKETGFFYDTRIESGEFVKVMGAECWLPLWAGIATPEQAKQVVEKMLDPNKFNSTLPLGTLDTSHPRLRPTRGYWRGPVWVDQVYFGITGMRNYGYNVEADYLMEKFIDNAQGLTSDGPIHENYNPLTGETLNCKNFGWSSALIIKMILDK